MRILLLSALFTIAGFSSTQAADAPGALETPFKDDPAVLAKINDLAPRSAAMLDKVKVEPAGVEKYHGALKNGPGRRDYCNKIPYRPETATAIYCGANHGSPHRLTDVWEFHLGSNTWRMICPPGFDSTRMRGVQNKIAEAEKNIKAGKDVEKNTAELESLNAQLKTYYDQTEVKDGYYQEKAHGGPVGPWHTWDGVAYDEGAKKLYWAVLDSDNFKEEKQNVQRNAVRKFAKATGQDEEKLLAQLKPSSSMYIYDPATQRWRRQMGEGPHPLMRGMGAMLCYIPGRDVTVWYCCVGNTPGGYTEGMWAYNAKANRWTVLQEGEKVSGQMRKGTAPESEIQTVYTGKHDKLITVEKKKTYAYDFPTNTWKRVSDNPGFGYDSHSVFAYDPIGDVCLLVSKPGGQYSEGPWTLSAYDVAKDKWEVIDLGDKMLPVTERAVAGYFDIRHNALVIYCGNKSATWIYRHTNRPVEVAN